MEGNATQEPGLTLGNLRVAELIVMSMAYACDGFSCLLLLPTLRLSDGVCEVCRYPSGYTLLFIPYYAPDYSGQHWAVYNDNNNFYGFDDGDATAGEPCASSHVASN